MHACAAELSGATLRPVGEGKYIIVADDGVMEARQGRLRVDNAYLRISRSSREQLPWLKRNAQLWLTRSTLQGDGSFVAYQRATGLYTKLFNQVLAQGVHFPSDRSQTSIGILLFVATCLGRLDTVVKYLDSNTFSSNYTSRHNTLSPS